MAAFGLKIYDENGDPVDAKAVGFHYETGNTSDIHDTQNQESNFDNTDADWDGDGVPVPEGDVILLHVYTDDACAVHRITSDNSDSYKRAIQLLPCQAPSVTINIPTVTTGSPVVVDVRASDEYQWEYEGETMYHKKSWYGKTWCDGVGIKTVEYDWGDGWTSESSKTFDDAGDYSVKVRVTSECDLIAEDEDAVRVTWNAPSVILGSDPEVPAVGQEVELLAKVSDPDNRVTKESWYMDETKLDELKIVFDELGEYWYEVRLEWNDGFEDQVVIEKLKIEMGNQAPMVDPVAEISEDGSELVLVSNAVDPEDDLAGVEVTVWVDSNKILGLEGEPVWVLMKTSTVEMDAQVKLHTEGSYRVGLQAIDGGGLRSDTWYIETEVACATGECPECPEVEECPECPDAVVGFEGAERTVLINVGSLVTGGIEIMEVNGLVEVPNTNGNIEEAPVNGQVENIE